MSYTDKEATRSLMNRSRNQLITAYAPGAFFTLEGGRGAAISIPSYEESGSSIEGLTGNVRKQIQIHFKEATRSWLNRALKANKPLSSVEEEPYANLCLDDLLLDENMQYRYRESDFMYLPGNKMSAELAPLSFICNRCNKFVSFSSAYEFKKNGASELGGYCPESSEQSACQWSQVDVIFVHWSGDWMPVTPDNYEYSKNEGVRLRRNPCDCQSNEWKLKTDKNAIGSWEFVCANPSCGATHASKYARKTSPSTLAILGNQLNKEELSRRFRQLSMKPVSYRANSSYYVHSMTFVLMPDAGENLERAMLEDESLRKEVAKILGCLSLTDDPEQIANLLDPHSIYRTKILDSSQLLNELTSSRQQAATPDEFAEKIASNLRDQITEAIQSAIEAGELAQDVDLPPSIEEFLSQRKEMYPTQYDPFRLLIEHKALEKVRLLSAGDEFSRKPFVPFTKLDEHLSPKDPSKKNQLERQTQDYFGKLGIETMGLIREFPLCKFSYGYTRVSHTPIYEDKGSGNEPALYPVRLNLFPRIPKQYKRPIYVITQKNEAFYVRLDPKSVYQWLKTLKLDDLFDWAPSSGREGFSKGLLSRLQPFGQYLSSVRRESGSLTYYYVYTLLHSYSHLVMQSMAEYSGLDIGSLSEYLFPGDLAFVIYRNGTTEDLGNLSALWRNNNLDVLKTLFDPSSLVCNSGSLCDVRHSHPGACPACIMIPETSCLTSNQLLSRSVIRGGKRPREDGGSENIEGFIPVINGLPSWTA